MNRLFILILIISFLCCKNDKKITNGVQNKNQESHILNEKDSSNLKTKKTDTVISSSYNKSNFDLFINKFFNDSIFRHKHINFPIYGYNSDFDTINNYEWEKESWKFYFTENLKYKNSGLAKIKVIKKDTSNSKLRLYIENSGYDINFSFKKIDDKWSLMSYEYYNY